MNLDRYDARDGRLPSGNGSLATAAQTSRSPRQELAEHTV